MSEPRRPEDIDNLKNQILILQKQLESKNIQNKNLNEKCEIQAKRIKFLKKEVDEYKLKQQRLEQSESKMAAQHKTMKDSNRKLKQAVDQLNRRIKEMQKTGEVASVITIGEKVIANNVEEIDLAGEGVTDNEVKLIVGNKRIRNLILGDNDISDVGADLICTNLVSLTKLFLNRNQISDKGVENIQNLKELKYLDLRYNKLTSQCCQHVARLSTVTQLSLSNNQLDDEATIELSKMVQLRYLDLTSNKITGKSVPNLLKLKQLTHLYLSSNKLTAADIRSLIEGLQQLSVGDFRFNGLKEEEKEELRKAKREEMQLFI